MKLCHGYLMAWRDDTKQLKALSSMLLSLPLSTPPWVRASSSKLWCLDSALNVGQMDVTVLSSNCLTKRVHTIHLFNENEISLYMIFI